MVQTSQSLETDKVAISNSLLSEIVQLLRARSNGSSFENVNSAITETTPSSNDVWVNGLWFTSLTLSLATALFVVLTKQWLRQYMAMTSGTTRDRSLIRQFRFAGMEKWHVLCIIGILPILLHLSLGIFLAGLIFFLVPRHLDLAYIIGSMTVIVYSLYFITNLVPLFDIQCPYRTPLTESINVVHHHFRTTILLSQAFFARGVNSTRAYLHRVVPCIQQGTPIVVAEPSLAYKSLRQREKDYVQSVPVIGSLSLDAIAWLMDASSNPSVHNVAIEAIGGLPPSQRERAASLIPAFLNSIESLMNHFAHPPSRLERIARSTALLSRGAGHCLSRNKHYRLLYTSFRDMDDLKGMVSALPLSLRATEENISLPERYRVTSGELFVLIDRLLRLTLG